MVDGEEQNTALQRELERARAETGKVEARLEGAMQLVQSARLRILSLQALEHLYRYEAKMLGGNVAANRHDLMRDALRDLEKADTVADIIPF